MKFIVPYRTKNELKTYSFIYLMKADLKEIAYIKSKIGNDTYQKMQSEFNRDNKYQSIKKTKTLHNILGYSKKEKSIFF